MTLGERAQREGSDVALLTGPDAADMLSAALGVPVTDWAVHTVHHRPGAGVTVGYTVTTPHGDDYVCATTGSLTNPDQPGLIRIDGPGIVVHVWRHPADPELPALKTACDTSALSARLGNRVGLELLSYRPTRRGVVRVSYDNGERAYAKVVRPAHAHSLVKRHRMLEQAGVPAPRVLLDDPDGLVLISEAVGTPLANTLAAGMGQATDEILTSLVGVLDRLPAEATGLTRRPAWSERADHYAHAASTVLPHLSARLTALADGINDLLASSDPGPLVPTHGDFYEANILVTGNQVSGLIDVDSLGPGYRVDDLGCLLGHISVLPHLAPRVYPHVPDELERWTRLCEAMVDPVALMARCAGVTLSLIAGARREDGKEWVSDGEGRLAAAEMWLARGRSHKAKRARLAAQN